MKRTLTACTRHCNDGCSLIVEQGDDGRTIIRGNPDHPFTAGFICAKTARFMDRLNAPERIVHPLARDKAGGGEFRRVSWDEAYDLIVARLDPLRATPQDILHVYGFASFGVLHKASRHLFALLGSAQATGSMCLGAGAAAMKGMFGALVEPDYFELENARVIVNWGRNMDAHSPHVARIVDRARGKGARVLAITPGDPGYAPHTDAHVRIRPGTDRFLAAAALRLLHDRGGLDEAALSRAVNAREFLDALAGIDVAAALDASGTRLEDAQALADAYGRKPTATLLGRGLQRYAFGGENAAFAAALAVATGNVGIPGAGVFYATGDRGVVVPAFRPPREKPPRTFSFVDLGGELRRAREAGQPVRFVWVEGTNVVTQGQDSAAVSDELERAFTVVVEPFMTDTARAADVILPPALMLECRDAVSGAQHEWLHYSAQVFAPRGEAKSPFAIARELAGRLNPPVEFPSEEEALERALKGRKMKTTLAELQAKGCIQGPLPGIPFTDGKYAHPDGLCRLPAKLHAEPAAPADLPLRLVSYVQKRYLLSQVPEGEQEGPATAWLAPELLRGLGLAPGEAATLHGERGSMEVVLAAQEGLSPDCVHVPRGDWLSRGRCVNLLTSGRQTDMGQLAAYYDQWCRIERRKAPEE